MLIGLGTLVFVGSAANDISNMFDAKAQTHDAFYIVSAASVAGAVYLLVAAGRNKRKGEAAAVTAAFKMEQSPQPAPGGITAQSYPSLAVRVRL